MQNTTIEALKQQLQSVRGCTFASFTYESIESGELARHTINIGADYGKALASDLLALQLELPALEKAHNALPEGNRGELAIAVQACKELIESYTERKAAHARGETSENYTCKDTYVHICKGLKLGLLKSGEMGLYVFGYKQSKTVIRPGVAKFTKSRPLTIAKHSLEKRLDLKAAKYRQFALKAETCIVRMNGETLDLN